VRLVVEVREFYNRLGPVKGPLRVKSGPGKHQWWEHGPDWGLEQPDTKKFTSSVTMQKPMIPLRHIERSTEVLPCFSSSSLYEPSNDPDCPDPSCPLFRGRLPTTRTRVNNNPLWRVTLPQTRQEAEERKNRCSKRCYADNNRCYVNNDWQKAGRFMHSCDQSSVAQSASTPDLIIPALEFPGARASSEKLVCKIAGNRQNWCRSCQALAEIWQGVGFSRS